MHDNQSVKTDNLNTSNAPITLGGLRQILCVLLSDIKSVGIGIIYF